MEQVIDFGIAEKEVLAILDKKKRLPSKRESLLPMVAVIAEGVQYGLVTIGEDGVITQSLMEVITDTNGNVVLSQVKYKPTLDTGKVNTKLSALPSTASFKQQLMVYSTELTGQLPAMINKMGSSDRDICDSISALFL